jgi:heptosyltransferase-1
VHDVPRAQHAVERNRQLAAAALGYAIDTLPDYGLRVPAAAPSDLPPRFCVLLHSTSRADKLWPEADWQALGARLAEQGIACVLPWGAPDEEARSRRLASAIPNAIVPGAMPLDALARLLGDADLVVGVDTGLAHLAVAAGAPTVAVFLGSDPSLTGVYGSARAKNVGVLGSKPSLTEVIAAVRDVAPGLL